MAAMANTSEHEVGDSTGARRRYLTVVFSDLSNSTDLSEGMETEDYADLLSGLRRACQDVIPRHGGTIVQMRGDGILAIFGHPEPGEDDGRRATEAALDLHERIRGLGSQLALPSRAELTLHTGIHSGLVLVEEGDAIAGRFTLTGSAVNIAARLSDLARTDEILVSADTLGAEMHFFETGELQSLRLQGIAEPVAVCRILERVAIGTRFEARAKRGLIPLVDRKAELRSFDQALQETIAGEPRCLAIVGPAGLGKTRLAEEFLHRAVSVDCEVHRGYCESYLSAEPLQPFLQMLRSLCGLTHGISASLAVEAFERTLLGIDGDLSAYRDVLLRALSLGSAAPKDETRRPVADNTIAALRAVFGGLAALGPLVLFIDDWQWADDATRQVLGAIRSLDRCAILVLIATRDYAPADVALSDAQMLQIAPFTAHEARETIVQLLPGQDPFVTENIGDYSGGNPLFIEELCHSVAAGHSIVFENLDRRLGRTPGGTAWLSRLIESRVERLSAPDAELVRMAAVIGNVIPLWLLKAISGYGDDDPIIRSLADQDLIFPGERPGTLRFKHGITRDVIYDSVGLRQRRALHLQMAEALRRQGATSAEEEFYESLAYHYGASGEATEAARYAELAGDKAMAASALDRAQLQYRAALTALDTLGQSETTYRRWMSISQSLASACVFDPSRDQLAVLGRAVELAAARDDQPAIAEAERWLGYVYYALGESAAASDHLERALGFAQRVSDDSLTLRIQSALGQASAAACDYDKALALLAGATAGKEGRARSRRPAVGFAYTLACKASVLGDQGRFDEADECFEEALGAVRGADHQVEGSVLSLRSAVWLWQGHWEEARQAATEAQRIAERVKSLYLYTMGLSLGAYAGWVLRQDEASLQTIMDATSWLASRDRGLFISLNYGWLADAMATSGRWQEARRYAAGAVRRGRKRDRIGEAMAYRAMARASAAGQNRKPAPHYLDLAMETARVRQSLHEVAVTQLYDAEIRLAIADRVAAAALLDQAGAAFQALAMHWHLDQTDRLRRRLRL